jgi:hypothetical protein
LSATNAVSTVLFVCHVYAANEGSNDSLWRLADDEEYINQVVCDFLLFIAEGILDVRFTSDFPIQYDDVMIVCSRQRGRGVQHEYLLGIQAERLTNSGSELLDLLAMCCQAHYGKGL